MERHKLNVHGLCVYTFPFRVIASWNGHNSVQMKQYWKNPTAGKNSNENSPHLCSNNSESQSHIFSWTGVCGCLQSYRWWLHGLLWWNVLRSTWHILNFSGRDGLTELSQWVFCNVQACTFQDMSNLFTQQHIEEGVNAAVKKT